MPISEWEIQKLAKRVLDEDTRTAAEETLAHEVIKLYKERSYWYNAYYKLVDETYDPYADSSDNSPFRED